jgi:hypothetical protein
MPRWATLARQPIPGPHQMQTGTSRKKEAGPNRHCRSICLTG